MLHLETILDAGNITYVVKVMWITSEKPDSMQLVGESIFSVR